MLELYLMSAELRNVRAGPANLKGPHWCSNRGFSTSLSLEFKLFITNLQHANHRPPAPPQKYPVKKIVIAFYFSLASLLDKTRTI